MSEGYVLITGATGGLGGAFVEKFVSENERLILLGRSQEKLTLLKGKIAEK